MYVNYHTFVGRKCTVILHYIGSKFRLVLVLDYTYLYKLLPFLLSSFAPMHSILYNEAWQLQHLLKPPKIQLVPYINMLP